MKWEHHYWCSLRGARVASSLRTCLRGLQRAEDQEAAGPARGIARQDVLQAHGEVSAASSAPGSGLEASRAGLPRPSRCLAPAQDFLDLSADLIFASFVPVSLAIKLIVLLSLCESLPVPGRAHPE